MKKRVTLLCALAGFSSEAIRAAQAPIDVELLEFLGSVGEEDDWQEYLEQRPVKVADGKIAKTSPKTPAKTPESLGSNAAPKEKDK
jgi:hypothetical protein